MLLWTLACLQVDAVREYEAAAELHAEAAFAERADRESLADIRRMTARAVCRLDLAKLTADSDDAARLRTIAASLSKLLDADDAAALSILSGARKDVPKESGVGPILDDLERIVRRLKVWPKKRNELRAEAMRRVDAALAADPKMAEAHRLRGLLLRDAWRLDEALEAYDRAAGTPGLEMDRADLLHLMFELWRGRPVAIPEVECAPLQKIRDLAIQEFKNVLGLKSLGRVDRAWAEAALCILEGRAVAEDDIVFLRDTRTGFHRAGLLADAYLSCKKPRQAAEARKPFPPEAIEWCLAAHEKELKTRPTWELRLRRAWLFLAMNRSEAAAEVEALVKERPGDVNALLARARVELAKRDVPAALQTTAILVEKSRKPEILTLRAWTLFLDDRLAEAKALVDAIEFDVDALYAKGRIALAQGDPGPAMLSATLALEAKRDFVKAWLLRAEAKIDVRDYLGARDDAMAALEIRPTAEGYVLLGRVDMARGREAEAEAELREAARLDPASGAARLYLGMLRSGKEGWKGALEEFDRAIQADSKFALAHLYRAAARLELGTVTDLSEIDEVIRQFPRFGLAYEARGRYRIDRFEDAAGAIEDFKKAAELMPGRKSRYAEYSQEWLLLLRAADKAVAGNRYPDARRLFEKAEPLLPTDEATVKKHAVLLMRCWYNFACVLAVDAKKDAKLIPKALDLLERADALGWGKSKDSCHPTMRDHMKEDADLEILRSEPRFKKLVE